MNFLGKILISALSALIIAYILPGVHLENALSAIVLALVLALLNTFLKPILVIFTIPITVLTLGLFLLVINTIIILIAGSLVPGFTVDNWWSALLFSILLSILVYLFEKIINDKKAE